MSSPSAKGIREVSETTDVVIKLYSKETMGGTENAPRQGPGRSESLQISILKNEKLDKCIFHKISSQKLYLVIEFFTYMLLQCLVIFHPANTKRCTNLP